ncbi:MAG: hypothetical protein K6T17_09100, partial [Fimbriimonadales bacterium]|nr:hypothetical protein [Fimbriimonadales bacterium]
PPTREVLVCPVTAGGKGLVKEMGFPCGIVWARPNNGVASHQSLGAEHCGARHASLEVSRAGLAPWRKMAQQWQDGLERPWVAQRLANGRVGNPPLPFFNLSTPPGVEDSLLMSAFPS